MFRKRIFSGILVLIILMSGMFVMNIEAKKIKDYKAYADNLDKTTYDGSDLGAVWSKNSTTFKLWSPTATKVTVRLYKHGSIKESSDGFYKEQSLKFDKATGIWSVTLKGDYKNKYYTYAVTNNDKTEEVVDIYAKAVGANGERGMVVDLKSTNPDGWDNDEHILVQSQTDATIWEVQVKDFSYNENSGVSKANRGKYLAFTEDDTVVNGVAGNSPTCIAYLKKLGVSYVQINPFYDFGSVDETGKEDQFNWGYDPVNYNVPEGSFSYDPYNGNTRIKECKQMIKALHDAGIGVIMDVVYNHTYTGEDSYFNKTVPYYYYRMNEDGTFSNGSGCGNDTASERKMFRKFMIDSVTYWAKEYHIDGFRFDLMGLHDVETMNQIRASLDKIDTRILMYGEAWDMKTACAEDVVLANQNNMSKLNNRIGAFDDTIRDGLKGNTFDSSDKGFLAAGKGTANLKTGLEGQSCFGWASVPTQTVSYSSCHDNYTLYDKLVSSVYPNDKKFRERHSDLVEMTKLNSAAIFASQGMTFFLAGEEFCRSKDGDENSYKSSATLNMIDWENVDKFSDVVSYYTGMGQIRKKFNAFRDSTRTTAENLSYFGNTKDGIVAFIINGLDNDIFKKGAVILNGNTEKSQKVKIEGENLPDSWVILANDETAGLRSLETVENEVELKPSSAMILVDKASFDKNINDNTGGVVVDYVDKDGNNVMKQIVTGNIGDEYSITPSNDVLMNYRVLDKKDTEGKFKTGNQKATITVEKYTGSYSSVTFRFIDSSTEKELAPSKVLTNQVGQQYYTEEIPAIEGYVLDTDAFPENGSGFFSVGDRVVTYKYSKEKTKKCQVKVIYMDSEGNVMDIKLLEGKVGENYNTKEKEYENLTLVKNPVNSSGKFTKAQQTVIYSYLLDDNSGKAFVVTILLITAGLLAAGGITLKILKSSRKRRENSIVIK